MKQGRVPDARSRRVSTLAFLSLSILSAQEPLSYFSNFARVICGRSVEVSLWRRHGI